MKQTLIAIALITLCFSLSAQTGIFGISFGQSKADVQKMLTNNGFKLESSTDTQLTFSNPKIKALIDVTVQFLTEGGVHSWSIQYDLNAFSGLIDEVSKQLTDLHKSAPYRDDFFEQWTWELANDMAIYMYVSPECPECLRVSYQEFYYQDDEW